MSAERESGAELDAKASIESGAATALDRSAPSSPPRASSGAGASGSSSARWAWMLLALLAFALRAFVVHEYTARHPNAGLLAIDEAAYDRWARAIASGDWIGREVFFQEPLYSYALGAAYRLGAEPLLVRLVQALLGALLCVAAGKLAERLFGRAAGLATAALLAVYAPLVLFPSFLLKEALLVPLLAALLLVLARTREAGGGRARAWFALGALGGLGALLRGNVLVLLPALALAPVARAAVARAGGARWRGAWTRALACAGGVALVLAPVVGRNHAVGGAWVLTTAQAGTNLYAGNNAENPYGRAYEVGFVRGVPEHEAGDWRREAERRSGRALDAAEVSVFWRDATLRSVVEDPALHARILWNKLRLTLGAYEVPDNHAFEWDVRYVPILNGPWPGFGLLGALGLAGLLWHVAQRARGHRPAGAADELALVFALYLATIVLTVTSDRARLPLVPMLAPFAATFALELVASARAAAWRRLGVLALLAAGALLFVAWPALPERERAEDLDERDFNLVGLLAREPGRLVEARARAAALTQRHPDSVRTRLLVLSLELENARAALADPRPSARSGARASLDEIAGELGALAPGPTRTTTAREEHRRLRLLGEVELTRGAYASARSALEAAARFDPDDPDLALALAHAVLGLADEEAALARSEPAAADAHRRNAAEHVRAAEARLLALRERSALPGARQDDATRARAAAVDLAWAGAEFARGLLGLAASAEAEQREAQAAIANALRALQPVAADATLAADVRARARRLAGRAQLVVATDAAVESAEKHFRAARALHDDPEARLGLAQALVVRAERSNEGRAARLAEAERLVEELAAIDAENPAVRELRERLGRLSGPTGPR